MDIQTLISDVDSLCDDEAATGDTDHLRNVRAVLEQLASYVAKREQGIEARLAGMVDTALGLETRADAQITQIAIDGEAMIRPVQPVTVPERRLPTLADGTAIPTAECEMCDVDGQVLVHPCNGEPARRETCGICGGDHFLPLDGMDEQ